MKSPFDAFAGIVTIVAGLIGIWILRESRPQIALWGMLVILVSLLFILYQPYSRSFYKVRRGLKIIIKKLRQKNYLPDCIISFNRTGSVVAGMLAVNMGVQEVLTVSRRREEMRTTASTTQRKFNIGDLIDLNAGALRKRRLLVVFMLIDTGNTLAEGLQYLKDSGITCGFEIATIYITPGAKNRWPNIVFAYETTHGRAVLEKLPWVIDDYHYV